MLYPRWQQIVKSHPERLALQELGANRRWTFRELAGVLEEMPGLESGAAFPQGRSAGFVFDVLRGWRDNCVVCPLEDGQGKPDLTGLPPSTVHVKITSGSTGAPRRIAFSAEQLLADVEQIRDTMGLRPDWPNLAAVSLAHSYGFSNLISPLLLLGIPLSLLPSPLPTQLSNALEQYENVTLAGVPALWRTWHQSEVISPRIRLAISAGAPLPLELEGEVFEKTGVKIHNFYGASECGGIAYDASPVPRNDSTMIGEPMKGVTLETSADGCLVVNSPAVGIAVLDDADPPIRGNAFFTSDRVELNQGRVHLLGRASDLINVAGRKVSPESVESAIRRQPEAMECVVFGMPEEKDPRGERVIAVVELAAGASLQELKRKTAAGLPAWQCPRDWWVVDAITTDERGKISRHQWRTRYANRIALNPRNMV